MNSQPQYNPKGTRADEFINHSEIISTLDLADKESHNQAAIDDILRLAAEGRGLNHRQASILLAVEDNETWERIFDIARDLKHRFYGRRIVLFAPLYLSNYCINGCLYCPYHAKNRTIPRKKLTQDEIRREVIALQDMGHKRIAVEAGEHPKYAPIEYILESLGTIYSTRHRNGQIRRANVNIAATTVDEYRKLHDAKIGTYILFQETYRRSEYERLHPSGPKSDYAWHTEAMDRAMQGGIEDVGIGVLFGLNGYRYELAGLLMHAEHLEATYGVGPHTVSVPRICPADDISTDDYPDALSNELFKRIVALIRISLPYTGLIISTRESEAMRAQVLELGVSQISGGSRTSVGGYAEEFEESAQFDISDRRTLAQVVEWLIDTNHIPSFCTACYRRGRTGEKFMTEVKEHGIGSFCDPNAILTLNEFLHDYAGDSLKAKGKELTARMVASMQEGPMKEKTLEWLTRISEGKRDLYF